MEKRLQDMTLTELWELFPIVLSSHNTSWRDWAVEEMDYLHGLLAGFSPEISHIGSTAIPGIQAKPIVDLLVETAHTVNWSMVKNLMESNGYICMSESECRMSFNKGYTPRGYAERVFHIHFHRSGDNDEIAFRDYLIAHPDEARRYEQLKLTLLPRFRNDRDGYTSAKTEFVKRIVAMAK